MNNLIAPVQLVWGVPNWINEFIQNGIPAIVPNIAYSYLSAYRVVNIINSFLSLKDTERAMKVAHFAYRNWLYGDRMLLCEEINSQLPKDFCTEIISDVKGNLDLKSSKIIFLTNTEKNLQSALTVFIHDKTINDDFYLDDTKAFKADSYYKSEYSFNHPFTERRESYFLNTNGINPFKHSLTHPFFEKIKKIYNSYKYQGSLTEREGGYSKKALIEAGQLVEEYQIDAIKNSFKQLENHQRLFARVSENMLTEQFLENFKDQYTIVDFKDLKSK